MFSKFDTNQILRFWIIYEEPEDEEDLGGEAVDRPYWENRLIPNLSG